MPVRSARINPHSGLSHSHSVEGRSRQQGHIFELPFALVFKEIVGSRVIDNIEIQISIVVHIEPEDAQSLAVLRIFFHSGLAGDRLEGAIPQIPVQSVRRSVVAVGVAVDQ